MGGSSRNANSLTDFPELSDERQRRGTGFFACAWQIQFNARNT